MSSGFLAKKDRNTPLQKHLEEKRKNVDDAFKNFLYGCHEQKQFYTQKFQKLKQIRVEVSHFHGSVLKIFDYYTHFIAELQKNYFQLLININDAKVKNILEVYTQLALQKEALGQIRGSVHALLLQHATHKPLLYKIIHAQGMFDNAHQQFQAIAPADTITQAQAILHSTQAQEFLKILNHYLSLSSQPQNLSQEKWWSTSTYIIHQFYQLANHYFEQIEVYTQQKAHHIIKTFVLDALMLILFALFISWLGYKIKNEIMNNLTLLQQYKNAVDRSSIVSKTDKRGIITYVNEQFCKISGYTTQELIGKSHNIVRHPEMPKDAFYTMWRILYKKQPWSGVVKNKKKDGSSYTVEATINPILDHNGDIVEFIAIRNDISDVIALHEELEKTQKDLIIKMSELTETRSEETGYHVRRVAHYSELLARYYGLDEEEIKYLTLASPMHDIGKVSIPDSILHKPQKLTPDEWEVMKTHTEIGYNLFKDSDKPLLQAAATIAYEHHEHYNGHGYPRGIKGDAIHIYARITSLADTFDALNAKRSYKKPWSDEKILSYLKEQRAKQFDPQLVDIFLQHYQEFCAIRDNYKD